MDKAGEAYFAALVKRGVRGVSPETGAHGLVFRTAEWSVSDLHPDTSSVIRGRGSPPPCDESLWWDGRALTLTTL